MVKGAVSLVVIIILFWGLWMTWEWFRNDKPNKKNNKKI